MLISALLFALLLGGDTTAAPGPTTLILVRHAEKQDLSENPPLSAAGRQRAEELARVLAGVKLDAIYTTPFLRTNASAEPVALEKGLKPVEFTAGKTYAADMAATLRGNHKGQTVLVVGHSNTTAALLKALGIADAPFIPESQFDNLFIVTIGTDGQVSYVPLRYGTPAR